MKPYVTGRCFLVVFAGCIIGCSGGDRGNVDSARALPPVYPLGPSANTNWNPDAGSVMILSAAGGSDTVAVVLPEATDSTIESLQNVTPPVTGLRFDLFGRGGKTASSLGVSPILRTDSVHDCYSWPMAKLPSNDPNWKVGFVSGRVQPIPLDSIEGMSSGDSSALAVSLAQTAATLPVASDPTFRGLPFRVRSAYTFRLDSVDVVVADVVRSVNEEANPRVEHLLIFGERPHGATGKFDVGYYSRNAGAEESMQATEILSAVRIGAMKRAAVVINVEYDDGGRLGLVERTGPGEWHATWRSAYTDC
jgi:hypothetical protein